jgi:ParB-like chromosome segregation protein Spo0J
MKELQIEYKSTDELIPYVNNSRTHSESQVTQIAASIKEFGFTNPILTDGTNGVIAGHGRLLAAKKLGMKSVPVIELHGLDEIKKKAYVIADNKIALNSSWDIELLSLEIDALKQFDYEIEKLGFSDDDLLRLSNDLDLLRMKNMSDDIEEEEKESSDNKNSDELFPFSVMVDHDQREIIFKALRKAKQDYDLETSSQAVWIICKEYIDE